jgi:hypothetical protein
MLHIETPKSTSPTAHPCPYQIVKWDKNIFILGRGIAARNGAIHLSLRLLVVPLLVGGGGGG